MIQLIRIVVCAVLMLTVSTLPAKSYEVDCIAVLEASAQFDRDMARIYQQHRLGYSEAQAIRMIGINPHDSKIKSDELVAYLEAEGNASLDWFIRMEGAWIDPRKSEDTDVMHGLFLNAMRFCKAGG